MLLVFLLVVMTAGGRDGTARSPLPHHRRVLCALVLEEHGMSLLLLFLLQSHVLVRPVAEALGEGRREKEEQAHEVELRHYHCPPE